MTIIDQLKRDEGFSAVPYHDSQNILTIGYGTNIQNGIDRVEAEFLLTHRYEVRAKVPVANMLPWTAKLDGARLGVLENMAYNIGIHGLLGFHNTLTMIEAGQYAEASQAMLESKWAIQVGIRAQRLAKQMATGEWQ